MVYIREAHPKDGWSVPGWSLLEDATDFSGRSQTANLCRANLHFDFLTVVDEMNDEIAFRWSGWPERLFVISKDGFVVYAGDQGPFGFNPGAGYQGLRNKTMGISLEEFLEAYFPDVE